MILTVTLNPSIDVSYVLNELKLDQSNRVQNVQKTAGGKGLNVSRVIHQLSGNVLATGLIGGHFGSFIETKLIQENIPHKFSYIRGESRSCIAILHDNKQTEVLEKGPEINEQEKEEFLNIFENILNDYPIRVITISGSLPSGLDTTFYSYLIKIASEKEIPVLLDCSGKTLADSIRAEVKPYLIKPNVQEITELLDLPQSLTTIQIKDALLDPLFEDIPIVMVSLGSKGALIKSGNQFYQVTIPKVKAVNSVGSGDSTIAGIAYALDNEQEFTEQIKTGITCGVLNAMNPLTGNIEFKQFPNIFNQVQINMIQ